MDVLKRRASDGEQESDSDFWSMVAILGCFFVLLVFSGCSSTAARQNTLYGTSEASSEELTDCRRDEQLGIEFGAVHLAAAGNMLDFRYRVVDPLKAAPLFDRKVRPYLLDEASGAAFGVPDSPKLGQLRTTRRNSDAMTDRNYHVLFANPGHWLQAGQMVSLVIGDIKVENLVVR
ncbi:MAG: hypothetical protein K8H84_12480 [Sulfuricella denitrificans]|nr:hypothetical protein [Sulfuricella denitrificans]